MLKKTTTKQISAKPLTRYLSGKDFVRNIDAEARTVELAFSSEEPFERWFGIEILDHAPDSIRLGRLQNGGAVLMDHDRRDHVAVVESVPLVMTVWRGHWCGSGEARGLKRFLMT